MKMNRMSSKSLTSLVEEGGKPSTVTRAGITADIKLTRGKQLVEHNPFLLIPDPNNPRPGEVIDEMWLKNYLKVGSKDSLCYLKENTNEYVIPSLKDLNIEAPQLTDDYNFLRELAFSIRNDGLIEPIEIFLADKNNDPEYFHNSSLEFGYVVLEGHQRRLAAMMAGVKSVTCIEITDETMLARLKVKHRKLRRQLSENNLRKGLTVAQNYLIVKELLSTEDSENISVKELSSIIGLNEDIAGALKRLCLNVENFPPQFLHLVESNAVSFKWIRMWVGKSREVILKEALRINTPDNQKECSLIEKKRAKARGRNGGAVKRSAQFKLTNSEDSIILHRYLLRRIPELKDGYMENESPFVHLEKVLFKLLDIAKMS